jgi:NADPH:quinone reductase-like Zn-dependent oxidoreductase
MRAAYYTKLGSARDVVHIGEIDMPSPGPGEIHVRVHVSGVSPSDWMARLRGRGARLPFQMMAALDGASDHHRGFSLDLAGGTSREALA